MKKSGTFLLAVFFSYLFAIPDGFGEEKSDFKVSAVRQGADGWEEYESPFTVSLENAKSLNPGQDSPEAALVHFYASKIRGDEAFTMVLPPPDKRSKKLQNKLEKMKGWTFLQVKLLARKEFEPHKYWIKIYMKVSFHGETDDGTDEAEVELIDGKWFVTQPPT